MLLGFEVELMMVGVFEWIGCCLLMLIRMIVMLLGVLLLRVCLSRLLVVWLGVRLSCMVLRMWGLLIILDRLLEYSS